jgi:hypothetical protein
MTTVTTETLPTPQIIPDTWPVAAHIATLRRHLPDLARQYGIKSLGVFGSYIRNEQTPESDLDVLVEFDDLSQQSLFSIVGIEHTLSDLLGVRVDLVLREGLKPAIGRYILDEVMWL